MQLYVERFLTAQLKGARRDALAVIEDALASGMSVPEVHCSIIRAAQYEVGALWQKNAISIAEEHVATAVASLALSWLYPKLPRVPDNGKRVLMACVEGEMHELGARLASDFLEMAGFEVRYVGANVPTDSLVSLVASERPDLLALSVTMPFHERSLRDAIQAVRSAVPDVPIVVGGHAFRDTPQVAASLGLEHVGVDPDALVTAAKRAVGMST